MWLDISGVSMWIDIFNGLYIYIDILLLIKKKGQIGAPVFVLASVVMIVQNANPLTCESRSKASQEFLRDNYKISARSALGGHFQTVPKFCSMH